MPRRHVASSFRSDGDFHQACHPFFCSVLPYPLHHMKKRIRISSLAKARSGADAACAGAATPAGHDVVRLPPGMCCDGGTLEHLVHRVYRGWDAPRTSARSRCSSREPSLPTLTEFLFLCATCCGARCSITFANTGTNEVAITSDHRCAFPRLGITRSMPATFVHLPCIFPPRQVALPPSPPLFRPSVFVFPLHVTNR